MAIEIKLPELGEGIESGDVLSVLVKEGDEIEKEQGVIEIETDKATAEVPASHAGRVTKIHVAEGQTIEIGATLLTVDDGAGAHGKSETKKKSDNNQSEEATEEASGEAADDDASDNDKPPAKPQKPAKKQAAVAKGKSKAADPPKPATQTKPSRSSEETSDDDDLDDDMSPAPAAPSTRRFARELGIDLANVRGTGPGGRIVREDIIAAVRAHGTSSTPTPTAPAETDDDEPDDTPATDADAWGPVRRERMSKVRQTIARKMHQSWTNIPRVTNYDDADVTELEQQRRATKEDYARRGIKLTSLPMVMKAVALCLKRHPVINASLDSETNEIVYKEYVNIGVAVDTERGLIVPVIRDVDNQSVPEIAKSVAKMAEAVRGNSFSVDDLRGGTFTISNLGAVGGSYSTPIINEPEAAILLLGRTRKLPVVVEDDQIEVREMMPLSLSYDHRLVDGAAAARFLNDVIDYLEDPARLLLTP